MPTQTLPPSRLPDTGKARVHRSPPLSERLRRTFPRLLVTLAAALLLTWLVALILAWTTDPRLGRSVYAEAWIPPGTLTTTQVWTRPSSVLIERFWQQAHKRPWGPEQATGDPDTPGQGDIQTAWAPATQDGQAEWLTLHWAQPVTASAVVVHQTYNPGAIVRIRVSRAGVGETIWTASAGSPEASAAVLTIPLTPVRSIDTVTLDLDSPAIPGWNEIDAVCLRDDGGTLRGATGAGASSSYADRNSPGTPGLPALPAWSGLARPPAAPGNAASASERRAEAAFGWPFQAWVAVQTLEYTPGVVGPGRSKPFAMLTPPVPGPMRAVPYRPLAGGAAANLLAYAVGLWCLQLVLVRPLRPIRRLIRMQRGHCPDCGYDLGYNFSGGCSECGLLRGR